MPAGTGPYQEIDVQNFDFRTFYKQEKKNGRNKHVILTPDPKKVFRKIRKAFLVIHAAGGLVKNEENEYLFIFRKGKWDLPKGKLDDNEKTRAAAEREVEEECGITVSKVGKKLAKTWHVYEDKGQVVFKKTVWYGMKAKRQALTPQLEEEITEARWLGTDSFDLVRANTFPLIRDVISLVEG